MKIAVAILVVLSLVAFAGQVAVSGGSVVENDADWLVYDTGTLKYLTWGGMYRGVWFNVEDFVPGMVAADVEESSFWFYHHSSYPWDSSDVYLEIWNGDAMGPIAQLDQTMKTAVHGVPTTVAYSPVIEAEGNFWAIINTEMSSGGWPSVRGDDLIQASTHSYYSDDLIVWSPWGDPAAYGNYFIQVLAELIPSGALDNTTWGSLKATF